MESLEAAISAEGRVWYSEGIRRSDGEQLTRNAERRIYCFESRREKIVLACRLFARGSKMTSRRCNAIGSSFPVALASVGAESEREQSESGRRQLRERLLRRERLRTR